MVGSLGREASDEQTLGVVDEWVELLAHERYEAAFDLIPGGRARPGVQPAAKLREASRLPAVGSPSHPSR